MNKLTMTICLCMPFMMATDCKSPERADRERVEEQQEIYAQAQPIPQFDYSLEREVVIELYEARNSNVATHTVWRSETGVIEGDCSSIGYPIPYDTGVTNPLQYYRNGTVIEQAEPNGLFASKNSTATWVRCVDNQHRVTPIYVESRVTAYPYPVEVDPTTNRVTRLGNRPASLILGDDE